MGQLIATNTKPSIQLEGNQFSTEINHQVYEDFLNLKNKYIVIDHSRQLITIRKSFFKQNKQVQNVTRYYAMVKNSEIDIKKPAKHSTFIHSAYSDTFVNENEKVKTIGLILESPHIDEYSLEDTKLVPIAPAQGIIGKKIDQNIKPLIQHLFHQRLIEENEVYRICIFFPIPYQTSLFSIHEKKLDNSYRELRDKIWLKMWLEIEELKQSFHRTLKSCKKNSILINACTKSIKPFITKELYPYHNKFLLMEINHPTSTSNWVDSLFLINDKKL